MRVKVRTQILTEDLAQAHTILIHFAGPSLCRKMATCHLTARIPRSNNLITFITQKRETTIRSETTLRLFPNGKIKIFKQAFKEQLQNNDLTVQSIRTILIIIVAIYKIKGTNNKAL